GQLPLLRRLPASLNLLDTWPRRKTTAAITARAMRATSRMYSTRLAPRSFFPKRAWSQVRNTNRFIPLLVLPSGSGSGGEPVASDVLGTRIGGIPPRLEVPVGSRRSVDRLVSCRCSGGYRRR